MGGIQYSPPFSNHSVVTRAVNTDYQNTSGKMMMVIMNFECWVGVGGVDGYIWVEGRVKSTAPASDGYTHGTFGISGGTPSGTDLIGSIVCMVPPLWYYHFKMLIGTQGGISNLYTVEVT